MSTETDNTILCFARFGMGHRLCLSSTELRVTGAERARDLVISLAEVEKISLVPSDANPSKLLFIATCHDQTAHTLVEGIKPGKEFQQLVQCLHEMYPAIEFDPPDMTEQVQQAIQKQHSYNLGCFLFSMAFLFLLLLLILVVPLLIHMAHML